MAATKGSTDYKASMNKLESVLDEYLGTKAPALPENIKDTLVSIAPYLAIVGIIISLPAILALFSIGAFIPFVGYGIQYSLVYTIGIIVLAISMVLEAMAIPGLFKRAKSAWRLMYYSSLIGIVASLLQGSISGALIGGLICLYVVFQLKAKYT